MDLQEVPLADPVSALALDQEACLDITLEDVFLLFNYPCRCACIIPHFGKSSEYSRFQL
jgi:hypothetical protein